MGLFRKKNEDAEHLRMMQEQMVVMRERLDQADAAKSHLEERIGHLDAENQRLSGQVGDVESRVGAVQGKVGTVETQLGTVNGKVGAVETQVGAVEGKVGTVETQLGAINGKVGDVETQVGAVNGKVGAVEGRVGEVASALGSVASKVGSVESNVGDVASKFVAVATKVGAVEAQVTGVSQHVITVESQVSGVTKHVDDVESQMAAVSQKFGAVESKVGNVEIQLGDVGTLRGDVERLTSAASVAPPTTVDEARVDDVEARLASQVSALSATVEEQRVLLADLALVAKDTAEKTAAVAESAATDSTPDRPLDEELRIQVGQIAEKMTALDGRVMQVSVELTNQLTELSSELDAVHERGGDVISIEQRLEAITSGQTQLANEQARYEIQFRNDLAELVERLRRPGPR